MYPAAKWFDRGLDRQVAGSKYPLALLWGALWLTGCASQGPLRPPSLHLPGAVVGLRASRAGDAVDLRWTNPSRTTDGLPLTGKHIPLPLMADICRQSGVPPACTSVAHFTVSSDAPGSFHDVLPATLATGPARPLLYRVRVVNGVNKGANATPVGTLAGAAPPPLLELHAEPVNGGVALRWRPDASALDRVLIHVTRGRVTNVTQANTTPQPANGQTKDALLAVEPAGRDAGGALDTGAQAGIAQQYAVARVRTLHVGTEDLTISSNPALVAVSAEARAVPPAPPGDLEAVANTLAAPVIDLSWSPVPGAVTYLVYRASGSEQPRLLSGDAISSLSYSDHAVRLGVQYRYSVAAIDAQGTQGARSLEVTAALPQP